MNVPVGDVLEPGLSLKEQKLDKKFSEILKDNSFTGYVILTTEGRTGIEEGMALIKSGLVIGSIYEHLKFGKSNYGEPALEEMLNSGLADFGVMDIGSLSKQQVDLIIAFNEKIELKTPLSWKELSKMMPKEYNAKVAEKAVGSETIKKESKFDVFKKLGLGGVG